MRLILVAAVAVAGLVTFLDSSIAAAAGWSVRVCRAATEASAINVWVSGSEGAEKANPWLTWKSDDDKTDFAVPADVASADADKIWVQAESVPEGGKFALCVRYGDTVVKHIHATTETGLELAKTGSDDSCPCAKGN